MCGIVGIADQSVLGGKDLEAIQRMIDSIGHRGPDGSGVMSFAQAIFGHVRLSIIDVAGGAQPMSMEDQSLCVVFNGEIYNYRALRRDLVEKGYKFYTDSDTEVLLNTYREYGPDCVHHLNGIFAFAVLDNLRSEVFLARDHLGVKPLYYYLEGNRLIFSSELKGFRAYSDKSKLELNHQALDCYLANRYVISPLTLLEGVYKLQPGHYAIWKNGELKEKRYWDLSLKILETKNYEDAIEELRWLLHDAVRLQMISDVPLGVMLSGGVDSTIITALMCREWGAGVKTFSVASSGDGWWDERRYARMVADRYETDHHELVIDPNMYLASLNQLSWKMDDLVADPASILLYHLSELAREHVTVALSGEGSDEIFSGYSYYEILKPWRRQRLFNSLPPQFLPLIHMCSGFSSRMAGYYSRYRRSPSEFASIFSGVAGQGLSAEERKSLVKSDLVEHYGQSNFDMTWPTYQRSGSNDVISNRMYADTMTWLPDNLLTKADRMSMAHGLELRVPFLDHRVVEFCASLPLDFKLRNEGNNGFVTKAILREAFSPEIPSEILSRKKQGFSLNWQEILATNGKDVVKEVLLSGSLDEIFNRDQLGQIVKRLDPNDNFNCQAALSLVLFGYWHNHFLS